MTRTLTLLLALAGVFSTAHAQDAQRGSTKVQMCIGCHGIVGYQADFPQVYKVPKIAGQDAKYIAAALTAYRSGDRKFPTMRSIASSLTDQDIADIAAYYSQLGKPDGPVPAALETPVPDKIRARGGHLRGVPRRELLDAHRRHHPAPRRPVPRLPAGTR
jgi:cytochrome c553